MQQVLWDQLKVQGLFVRAAAHGASATALLGFQRGKNLSPHAISTRDSFYLLDQQKTFYPSTCVSLAEVAFQHTDSILAVCSVLTAAAP